MSSAFHQRPPISSLHSDIIQTHILPRLGGPDLALTSSVCSELHSVSTEEKLWKDIATKTWPSINDPYIQHIISSFPRGHRSFYYDAFPPPTNTRNSNVIRRNNSDFSKMISAIDLKFKNHVIYSTTIDMAEWLDSFELRVADSAILDPKRYICSYLPALSGDAAIKKQLDENLTMSWILIDPASKRAVNLSSLRPVVVPTDDQYQYLPPGYQSIEYVTMLSNNDSTELVQCSIFVSMCKCYCNEKLHLKEITLQLVDMDGSTVMGQERLAILQAALHGGRGKRSEETEIYDHYIDIRTERNERGAESEWTANQVCCLFTLIMLCIGFMILLL